MPPIFILIVAIQVICVLHAMRNGNNHWIWILVLAPLVGCIAYALSHFVPELFGSFGVRRASRRVLRAIDPKREQRKLSANLERTDNIENRRKLAEEMLEQKQYDKAKTLIQECLTGIFERDPPLMLDLARAQFGLEDFAGCKHTLDDLIAFNPDFKSPDGHLLYAQSLEALGEIEKAELEYRVVKDTFNGEEARVRYGELLIRVGKIQAAKQVLNETIKRVSVSPGHYQKLQSHWLQRANAALKALPGD